MPAGFGASEQALVLLSMTSTASADPSPAASVPISGMDFPQGTHISVLLWSTYQYIPQSLWAQRDTAQPCPCPLPSRVLSQMFQRLWGYAHKSSLIPIFILPPTFLHSILFLSLFEIHHFGCQHFKLLGNSKAETIFTLESVNMFCQLFIWYRSSDKSWLLTRFQHVCLTPTSSSSLPTSRQNHQDSAYIRCPRIFHLVSICQIRRIWVSIHLPTPCKQPRHLLGIPNILCLHQKWSRVLFTTARIKTGFGPRMENQIIYFRRMPDFWERFCKWYLHWERSTDRYLTINDNF